MNKTKYLLLIIVIIFVNIQCLFSQSNNFKEFLPLNIGNTWVYYYSGAWPFGPFSGFEKYKIVSTYVADGKLYFKFIHSRVILSGPSNVVLQSRLFKDTSAVRIDSLSGNIYRNDTCHGMQEMLIDSLNARLYDTSYTCEPAVDDTVICSDTNSIIYFENPRISRKFDMPGFEGQTIQKYAKNLGLVSYTFSIMNQNTSGLLKGCVINGIVYGDTGLVGIQQISNEIPENFTLSQNYPNPFNPVTKIKLSLPAVGEMHAFHTTKLIIYDVLGREVTTLVNEGLSPGTYEVEWDGTNYPSGVYFYQLSIDNEQLATKKMVLIK
jgi:hypothetical protein